MRCRLARRQALVLMLFVALTARPGALSAGGQGPRPALAPAVPVATVLRVGDYVVCEDGDPQLMGHPGIRY